MRKCSPRPSIAGLVLLIVPWSLLGCGCHSDNPAEPTPPKTIDFPLVVGSAWQYTGHRMWWGLQDGYDEDFSRCDSIDADVTVGSHRYRRIVRDKSAFSPTTTDTLLFRQSGESLFFQQPAFARKIARVLPATAEEPWLLFTPSMVIDSARVIADAGVGMALGESLHVSLSVTRRTPVSISVPFGHFSNTQPCEYRYRYTYFWGAWYREIRERVVLYLQDSVGVVYETGGYSYSRTHWTHPGAARPADTWGGSWTANLSSFRSVP
jgi:hypothetical protein